METLRSLFPSAEDLLATAPEELGIILLRIAANKPDYGRGLVCLDVVKQDFSYESWPAANLFMADKGYPPARKDEIEAHLSAAWDSLRISLMIAPAPGINGQNGWMVVTKKGKDALRAPAEFQRIQAVQALPRAFLHESIAEKALAALRRGDAGEAVFSAFKAVEEAVRAAGRFSAEDVGVNLMRNAFKPGTGPLADPSLPSAEQEARMHLFAGAIGCYKNPHSHRTPVVSVSEAAQQLVLASLLLGVVDGRASTAS